MKHVMIDLETMGNTPGCAIVSIGAVKFDESGLGDEFYTTVELDSCQRAGLVVQADTLKWWMKQGDDARQAVIEPGEQIKDALTELARFFGNSIHPWGNGSDFDNAILAVAYARLRMDLPWKFWNNRCYRTMKSMFPQVVINRKGTHHNALDDAKTQAEHLVRIFEAMKGSA